MTKLTKEERIDKAFKEYEKIQKSAWKEYLSVQKSAWKEYYRKYKLIEENK